MMRTMKWAAAGLALLAAATILLTSAPAVGAGFQQVAPEEVGLSSERLRRLTAALEAKVEDGTIPGAVALIARRGKIAYFRTFGQRVKPEGEAMPKDAIFRIYSMTKPIVSVAAMSLWEEGRFFLDDPLSKTIPEFAGTQVGETGRGSLIRVPARRPITIQDLLRHTSGMTYGVFGESKIKSIYLERGINSKDQTVAEMTVKLAGIPLTGQPGSHWEYGRSTDVLGRVLEVLEGKPLGEVLQERVFGPLGMADSGFYVPGRNHRRIAEPYDEPGATRKNPVLLDVTEPPRYQSGGGGLVSTAMDYLRFTQMMLNGGELDGVRILSPKTVQLMASNHLGAEIVREGWAYLPGPGYGFGLGFAVRETPGISSWPGSVGEYYWGGYAGTYFWIDPEEELTAVYMMQDTVDRVPLRKLFKALVYQAIVD